MQSWYVNIGGGVLYLGIMTNSLHQNLRFRRLYQAPNAMKHASASQRDLYLIRQFIITLDFKLIQIFSRWNTERQPKNNVYAARCYNVTSMAAVDR